MSYVLDSNSGDPMGKNLIWQVIIVMSVFFACGSSAATTVEQQALAHVANLKAIRPNQPAATIETYNKQMDAAWKFFQSNKAQVLPVLQAELTTELARAQPNDLVLLDIGMFVYSNGGAEGRKAGIDALLKLNPQSPLVVENFKELFDFTYAAARDHDPRVLPVIASVFLPSNQELFVPQHALRLDGTLACVFLYGAYGPESESIVRQKLADKALIKRVLEILVWLGSPASFPQVRNAVIGSKDYETVVRATAYMMQAAGPEGRNFMLGLDANRLDTQSQQYLAKVLPAVRSTSFESARNSLAELPGDTALTDSEVASRLRAMLQNFGKDDRTSPLAILNSGLSTEMLIQNLIQIRSRTLHRLSDEALSDVEVTNYVINALRYRKDAGNPPRK
jgi:hypothetical protein